MSSKHHDRIIRKRVGELPLLRTITQRLGFRDILTRYIKSHGNEKFPVVDTLLLLVYNIASGRQPLYELDEWVHKLDDRVLIDGAYLPEGTFNDDRFARALDKLFEADRAALVTDIALHVIRATALNVDEIHNDSTSVKTCGAMPGKSATGLIFNHGHSKDHRPDLKQIIYSLTISADGAVPIHYKAYPGNRNDDTTHIETWDVLRKIVGKADFLYVADCKVCTHKQLAHIIARGGKVVTLMPNTWLDATLFKERLRHQKTKVKKLILRLPCAHGEAGYDSYYHFGGHDTTLKGNYTLHWIYSTEKRKRDRYAREKSLLKVEHDLAELTGKLNTRKLKTREQIIRSVGDILQHHHAGHFYHIDIQTVKEMHKVQLGQGRPSRKTQYKTTYKFLYTLSWTRNRKVLEQEKRVDGIFPILCTDPLMSAKQALTAYKYQPRLEKRFSQFKSVHQAAPTLFKKVERVEAMMCLFFMALILQAVIEREVRLNMQNEKIEAIPVYPEHRRAYHPTTTKIFDRFYDTSTYKLVEGDCTIKVFKDDLSAVQIQVLGLLGMTEEGYWRYTG